MSPDASGLSESAPAVKASSSSDRPATIILWSHPRSCSTMVECMFLTRPDEFHVLHEPMGESWYYSKERVHKRFSQETCEESEHWDYTYDKAWKDVSTPHPTKRVFSKDMASYITDLSKPLGSVAPSYEGTSTTANNPTVIPTSALLQPHIKHTFLIRHPRRAVPSYARLCYPGAKTGFDYFDPSEMGYKESRRLFDFIREETGEAPLVVEAEKLLEDPKKVVSEYCAAVGIDFREDMLEWNSATRDHFAKWKGWHEDAEKSTGVGRRSESTSTDAEPAKAPTKPKEDKPLSDDLLKTVEDNLDDYEYLRSFANRS
ncbi:hypothetical protein DMC30DRAFT_348546 [Rhodotorula diobovata]|uniref:P-loop containing nucleoside triphosphate hydrolase protein n=1 Tax=Rhodotorula diobovata TaxID=5288 RepID=A0A5C5G0X1_9BASI|nr:hypothetical protein DMC30DRAFT_348546 [Rhodotorula diobovata]